VQADFSASPLTGMDTLTVSFTNQISGDYTTSLWFFGDGETSLQPSPTHTYTAPGVYNVMLFASGPGGTDTLTRPAYIVVHGAYSHYLPLVIK
jgi:PKD repeat protein